MQADEVLSGGNTSVVVRVGDTVRRTSGHWTPAVHALLEYLKSMGFQDAPSVLGTDHHGREVLLYVAGEVGRLEPGQPLPPWFRTAEACRAIGDWLRRFHEAQRWFTPDPALPWRMVPGRRLTGTEIVVHHDVAPYNTILRPFGGLSVIDWDFCRPGDPIEDLAFSAWQWIPLWADKTAVATGHGGATTALVAATRLAALADGYDASPEQRLALVDACVASITKHADDVEAMAVTDPAFARLVDLGIPTDARRDAAWVRQNEAVLSAAVREVAAVPNG
jgi:Ser/Thr protein kinase RdoA (MazF antagonist)